MICSPPSSMSRPTPERIASARRALAGSRWRLLLHPPAPGAWNMAVDDALLEGVAADTSPPTLRLYGWDPPALSLGRFQNESKGLHLAVCRRRGWDVVRRPTGGRAVLHDEEITYSLSLREELVDGAGVLTSYELFAGALRQALVGLFPALAVGPGADSPHAGRHNPSCFATGTAADSLAAGRKLVGSAQVRRRGAILQHGSLLLRIDRGDFAELFDDPGQPIALADLLPDLPPIDQLSRRLAAGLAAALDIHLHPGELSASEVEAAQARARRAPPVRAAGSGAAIARLTAHAGHDILDFEQQEGYPMVPTRVGVNRDDAQEDPGGGFGPHACGGEPRRNRSDA
jgi:lipoyl(octanoyl) transferase